jgi:hypothetical protein
MTRPLLTDGFAAKDAPRVRAPPTSLDGTRLAGAESVMAGRLISVLSIVVVSLDGTVGVDAGRLGTPTFGPMLLTRGDVRVIR